MASSQNSWEEEYSGAFAVALILGTLFYNVYLIFRIKYGSVLITKETLKPYYYSLAYLICSGFETSLKCWVIWESTPDYSTANANIWNNAD